MYLILKELKVRKIALQLRYIFYYLTREGTGLICMDDLTQLARKNYKGLVSSSLKVQESALSQFKINK